MKYSKIQMLSTIAICFCFSSIAEAKGWRGIVPLKSTRVDVEKRLGKPNALARYDLEKERVEFFYAKGCDQVEYCECLVPKDTVTEIFVTPEQDFTLSSLNIDRTKLRKIQGSHLPKIVSYSNDRDGVVYTVDQRDDVVMHIMYLYKESDCQNLIKKRQKRFPQSRTR